MSAQETENQTGGAEPAEDASSHGDNATDGEAQADGLNPREKLKDDALKLIVASRKLGRDPLELVAEVLESIKD